MKDHPSNKYTDAGSSTGSVEELEAKGSTWRDATDEYLIGFVTQFGGQTQAIQTPAVIEMQRRLMVAVRASSDSADKFAGLAYNLNVSIKRYTVAMFVLATVQMKDDGVADRVRL
jgi:hypothetical protein